MRDGDSSFQTIFNLAVLGISAAVAYHGVKRNCGSAGWGLGWGLFGLTLAPVALVVSIAQGFAKPLPACRR